MAAGEELFGIDVGDGACGGQFKIAADELNADGRAGENGSGRHRGVGG